MNTLRNTLTNPKMSWSAFLPAISWRKALLYEKEKLTKKELALNKKELKLLRKERELQKKIKQLKKLSRRKGHAKADLKAANKLRRAKKKLLLANDRIGHRQSKVKALKRKSLGNNEKQTWLKFRIKSKEKKGFFDRLQDSPVDVISQLLSRPLLCYCNGQNRRNSRRRAKVVDSSFLRKVFPGPCDCQPKPKTLPPKCKRALGFQTCRCEYPNAHEKPSCAAGDYYLMTPRKTPQPCICHHRWPHIHRQYLRHQYRNFMHCLLMCSALLFWMPCFLCLEICKCCFFVCFSE